MYADFLILASLVEGPRHGYEIRQSIEGMLGGSCLLNNNQLYPMLRRFEADGAVTSTTQAQSGRPDRHVYTLTRKGLGLLRERIADFTGANARVDREFLIRVYHFHLITARQRRRILDLRMGVLHERLERAAARVKNVDSKKFPYVVQTSSFVKARTRLEMEWIGQLSGKRREGALTAA